MAGKVSAELNQAIEGFLENAGDIAAHLANVSNPHAVTKTQVGLSNVTNDKQATEVQLQNHTTNATNPHSVTKAQVGLSNVTNDKQATEANFNAHTGNVSNPHAVTKTQVGLGSVLNSEQATKTEYTAHVAGTADKHSATDVIYDELHNVKEYVDQLALESGTGTMDHSLLQNRDLANAHPISAISGLERLLDHKYAFMGTTTDDTETEIFTADTGTYIDGNGRIKVPVDVALALNIKLLGVVFPVGLVDYQGVYIADTAITTRFSTTSVGVYLSAPVIAKPESGMDGLQLTITGNDASVEDGDASLSLKVKGANAVSINWKAIVTVTPLSLSEFE